MNSFYFTCADPKSLKIQSRCQYLFALLGFLRKKAVHKMLMKLTPEGNSLHEI